MTRMSPPEAGEQQGFLSHLVELRGRLLRMVLAIAVVVSALLPFANPLYSALAAPLLKSLPQGSHMIATGVAAPFLTPFKFTFVLAIYLAVPYLLYQVWAFVAPGLYQHEKRIAWPLVVSGTLLFYAGMLFAYFVVFPLAFGFLAQTAPEGVAVMPDINEYLDFVLTLFFAFGVAFEVPVAVCLMVWMGVVTPARLVVLRPYMIVAAFVIGAILTPPDAITQTLLAVPMWLLYEVGIWISRRIQKKRTVEDPQTNGEVT